MLGWKTRQLAAVTSVVALAGFCVGLSAGTGSAAAYDPSGIPAAPSTAFWGTAVEVPGTAALNVGGDAIVQSLSCPSAGNCSAGGSYATTSATEAYVADEVNGAWRAVEMPGTGTLNTGGYAIVESLSCPSAGNCGAGGGYTDGSGHGQAFVANEVNGTWANAVEVPGSGALNAGGNAEVLSLSCPPAGTCSAGGYYQDGSGNRQAFVVNEP